MNRDRLFLADIVKACDKIATYISEGKESFGMNVPPPESEMIAELDQSAPGLVQALQELTAWYDAFSRPATAVGLDGWETKTLYHYTSVDALEGMTEPVASTGSMELWAGSTQRLNDTSEFILGWDVFHQIALRWPVNVPATLDMALCGMLQDRASDAYVLSLTPMSNNSTMWDRCRNGGRGVAIGFNLTALYESTGLFPLRICYEIKAFTRRCLASFQDLCRISTAYGSALAAFPLDPRRVTPLRTLLTCAALQYKSPDLWEVEQEVRLYQWDIWGKRHLKRRGGACFCIPLAPRMCVQHILAGPACSEADLHRIGHCRKTLTSP